METVTEILIDFSTSMKEKLSFTKLALLNDIIPKLDFSSRIGIKTFTKLDNQLPTVQILPLHLTDKNEIINAINSLGTPNGGTPITEAIRASVDSLKAHLHNDKKIILVTDGEEDAGGDYVGEAKKIKAEGINCEVHIIGIGLQEKERLKAEEISKITNGSVSNIPFSVGAIYNTGQVTRSLTSFYNSVNPSPVVVMSTPVIINSFPSDRSAKVETVKQEPAVEIKNEQEVKTITAEENNAMLKSIVDEIKEIKEQLKEFMSDRKEILEEEEDPIINEKIRIASEEYLNGILKKKYPERVKWLNENGEIKQDHDFEILDLHQAVTTVEYYIECKGTSTIGRTFFITKNEWRLFLNNKKNYQIYFVQNSFGKASHIFIDNLQDWLFNGKIVPYLQEKRIVKEERVFLTILETRFNV